VRAVRPRDRILIPVPAPEDRPGPDAGRGDAGADGGAADVGAADVDAAVVDAAVVDAADDAEAGLDRILTVPNVITLMRLLCLPLYWYLLFGANNRVGAAVLLAVLGATDWIDGYIARNFNQVSNFGKSFDPTADRLLFFVGIVGIMVAQAAPLGLCIVVLVREVLVGGTTVIITAMGSKPVAVTWYGKAGTFSLMFAFPIFLGASADLAISPVLTVIAWGWAIPGVVLSYYAAFRYIPLWRVNLREARDRKAAEQATPA